jgi:hypothetical protein
MALPIKQNIVIFTLVINLLLPVSVSGQFTLLNTPVDCGQYYSCVANIDFADKMNGYYSIALNYSPSSGGSYIIDKTNNGGETWELIYSVDSPTWVGNNTLFSINSETCFASFIAPFDKTMMFSSEGIHDYFPDNFNIQSWEVTSLNDSLLYLVARHLHNGSYISSSLYKIERDSIRQLYNVNWDSLQLIKAVFTDPSNGYIISRFGSNQENIIIRTTDGGLSWERCLSGDLLQFMDISFFNQSTGIVSCSNGILYRTTDSGNTWTTFILESAENINSLSFINEDIGYCGGDNGSFYKTVDRGQNWTVIPSTLEILKLQMIEQGFGYISTPDAFYKYYDGVGVENIDPGDEVSVFPNPTEGIIQLEIINRNSTGCRCDIFNMVGQVTESMQFNENSFLLDLSLYPPGMYFLRITGINYCDTKIIIRK